VASSIKSDDTSLVKRQSKAPHSSSYAENYHATKYGLQKYHFRKSRNAYYKRR
jgi:hypothetical protein